MRGSKVASSHSFDGGLHGLGQPWDTGFDGVELGGSNRVSTIPRRDTALPMKIKWASLPAWSRVRAQRHESAVELNAA